MEYDVFTPMGASYALQAQAPAPAGVQLPAWKDGGKIQYRFVNTGTVGAWVVYGTSPAAAQAAAVIPSAGSSNPGWYILPGTVEIFSAPPGQYWSAVTAGPSTLLFITPGQGG